MAPTVKPTKQISKKYKPATTFEFYKGKNGRHFWRAVALNGNIVADSAQGNGYATNWGAMKSARRFVENITRGDYKFESEIKPGVEK